ncbi:MAG: peptide ABC transporter substrate-binding protein [Tissierellales bacterium]|nr:peptide ABC transporter substrate-binding protein [Tissierellales bacterium]
MKKIMNPLIMFMVLMIFATGCQNTNNIQKQEPFKSSLQQIIVENGEISLPLTNFKTLNPIYTDNLYYYYFSKLMYEGLFEYDENLKLSPKLAESFNINDDGKSIDIKIRENIFFHDGSELTAEDVDFTINMLRQAGDESIYNNMYKSAYNNANVSYLRSDVLSKYSIRIYFDNTPTLCLDLLTFPIIKSSSKETALSKENFFPNGTGPYQFIDYQNNKEIHLRAYDNYWGEKAQITNITGKIFENEELMLTAFEAGKIHITKSLDSDWGKYLSNNRVRTKEFISGEYIGIAINHEKEIFNSENSLEIKKSLMYGINRQELIRKIFLSHGTAVDTLIYPNFYLLPESAYSYGYNLDKAKDLLDTTEYFLYDKDNIRINESGERLSFDLLVNGKDKILLSMANMIKSDLLDLGIELNLIVINNEEIEDKDFREELKNGDFELAIFRYQIGTFQRYESLLKSDNIGYDNFSRYSNQMMDALLDDISNSINEEDKRDAYEEFSKYFIEEIPYISIMYLNDSLLVDSSIKGDLKPQYYNIYYGLQECYLSLDK